MRAALPLGVAALLAVAGAQEGGLPQVDVSNPEAVVTAGNEAYNKGDWKAAAANFSALLELAKKAGGDVAKLEPLQFTLAACYFNIPMYDEAGKVLIDYVSKYPTGANVAYAKLGLARIDRLKKAYPDAIRKYEVLKALPAIREEVVLELADSYKQNKDKAKAQSLLEGALANGVKTMADVRLGLTLIELYEDGNPTKAVPLLDKIKRAPGVRPMVSDVNLTALRLADALMQSGKYEEALRAYQNLRRKQEVVSTLKELREDYQRSITTLSAAAVPGGTISPVNQQRLDRIKQLEKQAVGMVASLEKEENYDAVLFYRIGRCFVQLERWWEAKAAFAYVLDKFPGFEDKTAVRFAEAFCYFNLTPKDGTPDAMKLSVKTEEVCRKYLKEFPENKDAGQVADMLLGVVRANNVDKLDSVYEEVMDLIKDSPNKYSFMAIQVNSHLEKGNWAKVKETAEKYLKEAPADDSSREAVIYMQSLVPFFNNDYTGAQKALGQYLADYPNGGYLPDAKYRLSIMMMGEMRAKKEKKKDPEFGKVIERLKDIIETHRGSPTVADAWALMGDCYREMTGAEAEDLKMETGEKEMEAADAYMKAIEGAQGVQTAEYSLITGAPLYKGQERWDELQKMYEVFRSRYPEHRLSVGAVGEICKAIINKSKNAFDKEMRDAQKEGDAEGVAKVTAQKAEAKDKAKAEARKYLASTIIESINDPQREGVEGLIEQLLKDAVPKPKRLPLPPPPAEGEPPAPAPAPIPPLTVAEKFAAVEKESDVLLPADKQTTIGKARLLFVKAELLAELEKKVPKRRDANNQIITDDSPKASVEMKQRLLSDYKPEDYSPALLALLGERLMQSGEKDKALACYDRLRKYFPQSNFYDWALVAFAEEEMAQKEYEKAAKYYTQAIDLGGSRLGQATMGLARVHIEDNKLDLAEPALKEVIGEKGYGREAHAEATALLGEIAFKQGKLADAFNFFQRLYLSFAKYPKWMARGYLRAAETKLELQKKADALNVLREATTPPMSDKLKNEPDYTKIEATLQRLL